MIELASPVSGWVTPLDKVPDPVFSDRMLGDGIGLDPVEGKFVAPAAGTVQSVHSAGHAVTLALDSGPVLLMHVGLDTVALGGGGFDAKVKEGDRVEAGDTLLLVNLDEVARKAPSLVTPLIVTNGELFRITSSAPEGPIGAAEHLLTLERVSGEASRTSNSAPTATRRLQLVLAHGIHARPAGRLAKLASEFDADVHLVAADGRTAPVRSPVALLGLGLSHGAEFAIQGSGPEAEQAVGALAELLDSGMGELRPVAHTPAPVSETVEDEGELRGIIASPGMAIGTAWRLEHQKVDVAEESGGAMSEREALAAARNKVAQQLEAEGSGEGTASAVASAQLAMLGDSLVDEAAQRLIDSGKSAGFAWRQALEQFAAPLRASNDRRFAERLDDLLDLERRVLAELNGATAEQPLPPKGAIVIAETLYASQVPQLAEAGIAAIATAAGGATSHAAIIAAGIGLPMIVGLGPTLMKVESGTVVILRGNMLTVDPDQAALDEANREAAAREQRLAASRGRASELALTADGTRIEVFANLGSVGDAAAAVAAGAEGCGLLRTEFLFLDRESPPGEEEQRSAYQQVAELLGDRPLIVRTLDIGADKPAPWLPIAAEDNPALGLRGIRLQLARRELLETQLRALLGVRSPGELRIMVPMVSALSELQATKRLLSELSSAMAVEPPPLGIMVETPAAALLADTLAAEAAFFSIGSNDLSQYALARDRTNPAVAAGLDGLDPAVLRLIDATVRGGGSHKRVTGVCGSLAAVPEAVPVLIGLGVTELSVPPAAIAEVKALVRACDLTACQALALRALAAPDADAVRELVAPILEKAA